jgi:eukaryotic-like serine/threonine-protein kinase
MSSTDPRAVTEAPEGSGRDPLAVLLRRMQLKSDFPALSDSVARIHRLASSDHEGLGQLTNEILKDVALTHKLLRLVNSAHFAAAGGQVNTVSRAVALVGYNGIRNLALSLVLLEHMEDQQHAERLKEEFLRCLLAGSLADGLCASPREREEAFLAALFHNLGRLLAEFYFPEEARTVRDLMQGDPAREQTVSAQVLGISYDDLGLGIAHVWGLPESLRHSMRRPSGSPPLRAVQHPQERQRWLALAANDVTDALLELEPHDLPTGMQRLSTRYSPALGIGPATIQQATETARMRLREMADAMGLQLTPDARARRLLPPPPPEQDSQPPAGAPPDRGADIEALHATALPVTKDTAGAASPPRATELLLAGIQDLTLAMVEDAPLNQLVRMALETLWRALGLRRIVFCLRDPKSPTLTGRFGLGEGMDEVVPAMRIALQGPPDLFNLVCSRGIDTLISDSREPHMAHRLPPWFRASIGAPCFLLMPLQLKGSTFALIYGDSPTPGGIVIDEQQLGLLRTLRNQAVMAFRQAGPG